MLKRLVTIFMIGLLTNLSALAVESEKEKKFAEKVKTEVAKLGVGKEAKITVKLKDGRKLKGYLDEIKSDSFLLTEENSNCYRGALF